MFNVVSADASCPQCGDRREVRVQFRHGVLDLHVYRLGEELRWDESSRCAFVRRTTRSWCGGYGPPCEACGYDQEFATYAVVFDGGRVTELLVAPLGQVFPDPVEALPLAENELPSAGPMGR